MTLHGKIALVTGASRGIGREIALALAHAGADVACVATREENAAHTVDPILRLGRRACAIAARVERPSDVAAMVERAGRELGPIDILVNNAGIPTVRPVVDMAEGDWDAVLDVNAKGVFLCSQAVARQLIARKSPGVILQIGSISGINAFPDRLAYCASKAAVHHMTKVMAAEWAVHGIRVNCVAPGYIHSDITAGLAEQGLLDLAALRRRIPQGELGQGRDVAQAAVYLAGDGARYVTGSVLVVDGGWLAYGFV
jgi:NAD(P)-dependent dehydrogenase (short-subunit alcohol dehydrogenase family)